MAGCDDPGVRILFLLWVCLLTLTFAGVAGSAPTRDALVRPGEGIGNLRLGMTRTQALRALDRPVVFERARVFPGLRYLEYRTKDRAWRIGLFGARGGEQLLLIRTELATERTKEGLGVGTPILTLRAKLRVQRPKCIRRYPFINYRLHMRLQVAACAIRTETMLGRATTSFSGRVRCAVPLVRYQGCPRIRYFVAPVTVESNRLYRYGLHSWNPDTSDPLPPTTRP